LVCFAAISEALNYDSFYEGLSNLRVSTDSPSNLFAYRASVWLLVSRACNSIPVFDRRSTTLLDGQTTCATHGAAPATMSSQAARRDRHSAAQLQQADLPDTAAGEPADLEPDIGCGRHSCSRFPVSDIRGVYINNKSPEHCCRGF
jgi:hypothetical protein